MKIYRDSLTTSMTAEKHKKNRITPRWNSANQSAMGK